MTARTDKAVSARLALDTADPTASGFMAAVYRWIDSLGKLNGIELEEYVNRMNNG